MINKIIKDIYIFAILLTSLANFAFGQEHKIYYLLGEDIYINNCLVLCTNSINKVIKQGGGLTTKSLEELTAEITLVNCGTSNITVNPKNQFKLITQGKKSVDPTYMNNSNNLSEFNLYPNTQTRLVLSFALLESEPIKLDENEYLCFEFENQNIYVICDSTLPKLYEMGQSQLLLADDALKLSNYFCKNQDYESAKKILENSIGRSGYDPRLLLELAYVEDSLGYKDSAKSYLKLLESKSNLSPSIILPAAEKAYSLSYYELVIKLLEPHYHYNQLRGKHLLILAKSYYFLKNYTNATKLLYEIINNNLENKEVVDCAYFTLGNIEEKYNNYTKAIEFWSKALEITPSYYEAWFNLGVGYYKLGDKVKARHAWEMVLKHCQDLDTKKIAESALSNLE